MLVALAQEDSTNAGFFLDSAGQIVVLVTRDANANAVRQLVQHRARSGGLGLPARYASALVRMKHAEYAFQQLSDWRDDVSEHVLSAADGIISVDLDEARNRVTIGLDRASPAARARAIQRLHELSIPEAAVFFELTSVIRNLRAIPRVRARSARQSAASLDSSLADTLGGGFAVGNQSKGSCSISIVADRSGVRGFVGSSHCSERQFVMDGGNFFKVDSGFAGSHRIGHEVVDPPPPSGGLVPRNSDANFVALDSAGRRGAIGRTQNRGSGQAATIALYSASPWINIFGVEYSIAQGEDVDKMGRVTGWTHGAVQTTCIDKIESTGFLIHCLTRASVWVRGGDSGGTVFSWDGAEGARYYGVVAATCGGCDVSGANDMYFSSYQQILLDLGNLTVTSEITVGTPSISGSLNAGVPTLSWSSVSTTNTTSATSYQVYRSVWNASTYTWSEQNHYIGSTTSTSYSDGGAPVTLLSYASGSRPAECVYTYVEYWVRAYNAGIAAPSLSIFFQGNADGPTPNQFTCP